MHLWQMMDTILCDVIIIWTQIRTKTFTVTGLWTIHVFQLATTINNGQRTPTQLPTSLSWTPMSFRGQPMTAEKKYEKQEINIHEIVEQ